MTLPSMPSQGNMPPWKTMRERWLTRKVFIRAEIIEVSPKDWILNPTKGVMIAEGQGPGNKIPPTPQDHKHEQSLDTSQGTGDAKKSTRSGIPIPSRPLEMPHYKRKKKVRKTASDDLRRRHGRRRSSQRSKSARKRSTKRKAGGKRGSDES
jgi:hypothetical protein